MTTAEQAFPSRLLRLGSGEAAGAEAPSVDPTRINQHIAGLPDGKRVMTDEEVARLLNDPFATLVLRQGRFPKDLSELIAALDAHNNTADGLPLQKSYLISEGAQIPFALGVNKGGSRLILARFRNDVPELMVSTLIASGVSPRSDQLLIEVQAWDPVNRTMHFYQRQGGAWFWCGQSDMALVPPTRDEGPFDSHVNGYPLMKELKTPWVHWHGPDNNITETAYAPDDPLVSDPLFADKDQAFNFEGLVVRPLAERWNTARFEKLVVGGQLTTVPNFMRQVIDSTTANLISTHKRWDRIDRDNDLDDLPPTFFFDQDSLVDTQAGDIGLQVEAPPLRMSRQRYQMLVNQHDLRVRGEGIDQPGDVPLCFTVPERAFEDVLVTKILIQRGAMSARLAACLLMIDFPNPINSPRRASLLRHVPDGVVLDETGNLDAVLVPALLEAASSSPEAPEAEFATNWNLGPDAWMDAFATRVGTYLAAVAARLGSDEGCDDIFRLAESRRREFRQRPLAEFGLSLPQAVAIADGVPPLEMHENATVGPRP